MAWCIGPIFAVLGAAINILKDMLGVAVLIICHGRSGSTLLEEAVALTGLNNYFEPLDRLRNPLPRTAFKGRWGSTCMEDTNDPEDVKCPLTDTLIVANLLRCRVVSNAGIIVSQREASSSSIVRWDADVEALYSDAVRDEAKCHAKSARGGGSLVKAIRLNGHLDSFLSVWHASSPEAAAQSKSRTDANELSNREDSSAKTGATPLMRSRRRQHPINEKRNPEDNRGRRDLRVRGALRFNATRTSTESEERLRVIQLIRDPRGLIASRLRLGWCVVVALMPRKIWLRTTE